MTTATGPSTTSATVKFFTPPPNGEKAWRDLSAANSDGLLSNSTPEPQHLTIHNLRGREDSVSLDTAGFQLYSGKPAKHTTFANEEEIQREYYPESIELIKELTGASRVVVFDHTIRRRTPGEGGADPQKRQPVAYAHVDQTPKAAEARVIRHLPAEEVPQLLKRRYQIINLWRPINHAAIDWPLALCDFRSVDAENDVVPVTLLYPNREPGETYGVQHNPAQRWNYWYGMTPEEVVLIKCFDSVRDVALFTPHTAFEDPTTPAGTPLRESIEVRALVFYDD
ncbi:hypothetical protein C8J56DRAFT_124983 [Mycena floridula]|nr:hypothetical protein C8J56DRAFT_124983 [Mycena floridula]